MNKTPDNPTVPDVDFALPFEHDPAASYTMPSELYTSSAVHEHEKAAIFYQSWQYAGHQSQITKVGDYLTVKIHQQNIIVLRDHDQQLKAFYNVCQHRGHELLSGNGNTQMIVCPYHAWSYSLDGELKAARNTNEMPNFKQCDFALKPVQVEELCGMVFINLDPFAEPLTKQAVGLEQEIRAICPSVDDLVFAQQDDYDVNCNWKVMVDNFLECYHCHTAHKDFVDLVDMQSYRSQAKGIYSSHVSRAARTQQSKAYYFKKGEVDFGYAGWFLWPNTTIWAYPGEANLSVLQINPAGVERTIEHQCWFTPSTKPSKQLKEAMDYQKDVLQPEDIGLCESVQRGLQSKGYDQGRFVVDKARSELSEHAVHHFQKMVVDALRTA